MLQFCAHSQKICKIFSCLLIILGLALPLLAEESQKISTTRFGDITLLKPSGTAKQVIIFLSDLGGISADEQKIGTALTLTDNLVALIDTSVYIQNLNADTSSCISIGGEFVRLSQMIQKEAALSKYLKPVLGGTGAGGTLAYIAANQAEKESLGVLSFGFCPVLKLNKQLCEDPDLTFTFNTQDQQLTLVKAADFDKPWFIFSNPAEPSCPAYDVQLFINSAATALFIDQPLNTDTLQLSQNLQKFFDHLQVSEQLEASDLSDSLIELPSTDRQGDDFVILLSGDGGWANIDKQIGDYLAEAGVHVLGFNSLKYFWSAKSPEQAAADLDWIIDRYLKLWHRKQVVLIGFSLGADVLPAIYNRLNASSQQAVSNIVLLNPALKADLEVHISDWFVDNPDDGLDILPEVDRITKPGILCIYGSEEKAGTVCTLSKNKKMSKFELPGSHHFDGDYARVAKIILSKDSNLLEHSNGAQP